MIVIKVSILKKHSILILTDNREMCYSLKAQLIDEHIVEIALDVETGFDSFSKKRFDFIFVDLTVLKTEFETSIDVYKNSLKQFWEKFPSAQIIVMTSLEKTAYAVTAVHAGATGYLTFPIDPAELKLTISHVQKKILVEEELDYLRNKFWKSDSLDVLKTYSPKMKKVYSQIKSVAETKMAVLLTGETGTGKGVLARLIHRHSSRSQEKFISLHCGAIPDSLVESELFGYEEGAFTGAKKRKLGKFELATKGTIFLDEIGTVTLSAQIKLLQVLQDGVFQRVGGERDVEVDVRVVAATNSNLKEMSENNEFRSDLYYRLCVFPIEIPPLRERAEDIPHIVDMLIQKFGGVHGKEIKGIRDDVLDSLQVYSWPGNIRELENILERAYIIETSSILTPESFPQEIVESKGFKPLVPIDMGQTLAVARIKSINDMERQYLKQLMEVHKGTISSAAESAGITTRQLYNLLTKYKIRKEDYKPITLP